MGGLFNLFEQCLIPVSDKKQTIKNKKAIHQKTTFPKRGGRHSLRIHLNVRKSVVTGNKADH